MPPEFPQRRALPVDYRLAGLMTPQQPCPSMKLLGFGRPAQRRGGGFPVSDESRHFVEVAGADFALMFSLGVTIGLGWELCLLQVVLGSHSALAVTVCKHGHAVIESV